MENTAQKNGYKPISAVWELTMNCNMRCKHCGSSCSGPRPDELTTDEALALCDSLARLGLKKITLSGGEPLTRPDWHLLVKRFTDNGVRTNIITNGWYIDAEIIRKAKESGCLNFGISIDGLEDTHDFIRKQGSFARIMNALDLLREENMPAAAVTCVHGKNIDQLPQMKEVFISKGVKQWQLQAAIPMGNLLERQDWLLQPEDCDRIIDFAYENTQEGRIKVHLADDLGYFNLKEIENRKMTSNREDATGIWVGCQAGKRVVGVRSNGDIIGCLSIRDDHMIEGNIRQTSLEDLWNRPGAFSWNRDLRKENMTGFCRICTYAADCLGGCSGTKHIRYKTLLENKSCSYRIAVEKERRTIMEMNDPAELVKKGREMMENEDFQLADIYIARALENTPNNTELLNLLGFINYNLENFPECEEYNRRVLRIDPQNAYALKGLGICVSKRGRVEEGVGYLRRSIELASDHFLDPFHDLAVVLSENNRIAEALEVLEEGGKRSGDFKVKSEAFYRRLLEAGS